MKISKLWERMLPLGLLAAALFLLLRGIGNVPEAQIWEKASTICLECIGIG